MKWLWITLGALWAAAAIWKLALPRKRRITGNFYTAKPTDPSPFAEAVRFGDELPEGFKRVGFATEEGAEREISARIFFIDSEIAKQFRKEDHSERSS